MDVIILTTEQYQELVNRLDAINAKISKPAKDQRENYISNVDFVNLMKISKRTAKRWRDEGKISYSQIDRKIYYRLADVDEMMSRHHEEAFMK